MDHPRARNTVFHRVARDDAEPISRTSGIKNRVRAQCQKARRHQEDAVGLGSTGPLLRLAAESAAELAMRAWRRQHNEPATWLVDFQMCRRGLAQLAGCLGEFLLKRVDNCLAVRKRTPQLRRHLVEL